MTYRESLAWLFSTQQFGIKLGLENTVRLLEVCGNPQDHLKIIHVAGTNGKGSVCAMTDSILRESGIRTGLYTSPHLVDFRERISVNGEWIDKASVTEGLKTLRRACEGWEHSPTFFEFVTVLALDHFARQSCEMVVLETGMGGRLDATNAVEPIVSVITPIAMDHAEWLGDTLEKIAGEKAGIIKRGIPVVCAPQRPEVESVLRQRAARMGSAITFVNEPYGGEVGLHGSHQLWNASLAREALRAGRVAVSDAAVEAGLRQVRWPARFQEIASGFILDGAHNPHSATALVETWKSRFGALRPLVIFGALQDKDYAEMIRTLDEIADSYLFVPVASARLADPQLFSSLTSRPFQQAGSLKEALASVQNSGGPTLITGSLFLAGEALSLLQPAD